MHRAALLLLCAASLLSSEACLVNSQCHADYDCTAPERCNPGNGTQTPSLFGTRWIDPGQCFVECKVHSDCWAGGVDNGKQCVANRCEFRFDERVAALNFCQTIVNPNSGRAGQSLCLSDLKGKVVLLYFGYVT